jgi:nitroimidazol reductase NimA-like FMN-containing flavoprotein (pyridoxamine 5'-phosphate oxidase superfamily)
MLGELPAREIERLLESECVARIGCHVAGRTYIVPVSYVYRDGALVGHTAAGMKLDMLRKNPRSVVAWGWFEELDGDEAESALNLLTERFMPFTASGSSVPAQRLASTTPGGAIAGRSSFVYRIRLTEKTGRFERTP